MSVKRSQRFWRFRVRRQGGKTAVMILWCPTFLLWQSVTTIWHAPSLIWMPLFTLQDMLAHAALKKLSYSTCFSALVMESHEIQAKNAAMIANLSRRGLKLPQPRTANMVLVTKSVAEKRKTFSPAVINVVLLLRRHLPCWKNRPTSWHAKMATLHKLSGIW